MTNTALAVKLLIPVVPLVGWLQPPQNPPPARENQPPRETQPGELKKPSMTHQEDPAFRDALANQEKRLWESMKAADWKAVEAMSSDRFVMVCPEGIESRNQAIEKGKQHKLTAYTLSEWKSIKLDNDTGLIMYKAECSMTPGEGGSDRQVAYHSTLWRKEGNSWLAEMHQATPAEGGMKEPGMKEPKR